MPVPGRRNRTEREKETQRRLTRFRRGEIWVLITTDLLARGVDFRGLNGVVNYDVPNSAAAYVHRVGRTGRAGREGGVAVTFYTQEDIPHVKLIANVIRASDKLRGEKQGEESVKQWLLDALPAPTKKEKQMLKKRGVEARRTVMAAAPGGNENAAREKARARISTKSGYVRKVENNRREMWLPWNKARNDRYAMELVYIRDSPLFFFVKFPSSDIVLLEESKSTNHIRGT